MGINWKLRIKNKTTLVAILSAVIGLIYQILVVFGIIAPISEEMLYKALGMAINLLVMLGIVVDPTTSGVSDSEKALEYSEPRKDV